MTRCTYEDKFPVGSSDKLRVDNVNWAYVNARDALVARAAALNIPSVSCWEALQEIESYLVDRFAVTVTVNAAIKLNWVVLQLDTVLRYVFVTVLVFTHPEQPVGYTAGG